MLTAGPADAGFLDTAPLRLRETFAIARPSDEVWAQLTAGDVLSWCRIIQDVSWTSPRPYGVGTTRTVRGLAGASVIEERFFRWEEGRRQSFYAVAMSAPMFRRLAEDYELEPGSGSDCRLTWTIAIEPRPWAGVMNPMTRRIFATLLTDTRRHFAER